MSETSQMLLWFEYKYNRRPKKRTLSQLTSGENPKGYAFFFFLFFFLTFLGNANASFFFFFFFKVIVLNDIFSFSCFPGSRVEFDCTTEDRYTDVQKLSVTQ